MKVILKIIVACGFLLLAFGCAPDIQTPVGLDTGDDSAQVSTAAVQTAYAQLTQTALAMPTQTPLTVTEMMTPETVATEAAAVEIAEETPVEPSSTPTATYSDTCNLMQLLGEVSVGEGAIMMPGESFTKTWRLLNVGECVWTGDYQLVFIGGESMEGPESIPLNTTVYPGEVIDLSLKLRVPETKGRHIAEWKLQDNTGAAFGVGENAEEALWVSIDVADFGVRDNSYVVMYFIRDICAAEWTSSTGVALCESQGNAYESGAVYRLRNPVLEGENRENEPVIITIPSDGEAGWISGRYPPFRVQKGDYFFSWIGCLYDSPLCDVTFKFEVVMEDGEVRTLQSWQQTEDESFEKVFVNLSSLVGETVEFVLTVENNGMSREDRAFWLGPAIMH